MQHRLKAGGEAEGVFGGTLVTASRDGLRYSADFESLELYKNILPGTHVAVHLSGSKKARDR